MTGHEHIRRRILDRAGIPPFTVHRCDPDTVRAVQWSPEFERLMRNRLELGAIRYGTLEAQRARPVWGRDHVESMRARLDQYERTGNTECLVDVANLALIEFEIGRHPKKHFQAMHGDHVHPHAQGQP